MMTTIKIEKASLNIDDYIRINFSDNNFIIDTYGSCDDLLSVQRDESWKLTNGSVDVSFPKNRDGCDSVLNLLETIRNCPCNAFETNAVVSTFSSLIKKSNSDFITMKDIYNKLFDNHTPESVKAASALEVYCSDLYNLSDFITLKTLSRESSSNTTIFDISKTPLRHRNLSLFVGLLYAKRFLYEAASKEKECNCIIPFYSKFENYGLTQELLDVASCNVNKNITIITDDTDVFGKSFDDAMSEKLFTQTHKYLG